VISSFALLICPLRIPTVCLTNLPPILGEIKGIENTRSLAHEEIDFNPVNVDRVLIKRRRRKMRGFWRQIKPVVKFGNVITHNNGFVVS